jgi:hypothetical protein
MTTAAGFAPPKHGAARSCFCQYSQAVPPELLLFCAAAAALSETVYYYPWPLALLLL